jgi:hypothetical protein
VSPNRDRPLRILVGTVEIAGTLPDFADGLRRLGHHVTTVIRERNKFYPDFRYDMDIGVAAPDIIPWPEFIRRAGSSPVRLPRGAANRVAWSARLARLVANHDIFMFVWGGVSLFVGNGEFPWLKTLGKRIVSVFMGSDVRSIPAFAQQYDYPSDTDFAKELLKRDANNATRPLRALRMAERHSDLILSVANQSALAIRPYMHLFLPIDLSKYECRIPERDIPVVVHAPSSQAVKGSAEIQQALDRLRADGVRFELQMMTGVPHRQVLAALRDADIGIDQLYLPLHGKFGIEAMTSGCALASCNRQDYEPVPCDRPVWHIDTATVYEQLKAILTDAALRVRLAVAGRKYVERHHDHVIVARRILERLDAPLTARHEHYPTFFAKRYRLSPGEIIPEDLKIQTAKILRTYGLPAGVDLHDMVARGLVSADVLKAATRIVRWAPEVDLSRVS